MKDSLWQTTALVLRVTLVAVLLVLSHCAHMPDDPSAAPSEPVRLPEPLPEPASIPMPLRGDFQILALPYVQRKYNCGTPQQGVLFRVEDVHVVPGEVMPGEEVNQVVSYLLCPSSETAVMRGRITRVITFQGREVFRKVTDNIEFKPGLWALGVFVGTPKKAKNGTYVLHTTIVSQDHHIAPSKTFQIKGRPGKR